MKTRAVIDPITLLLIAAAGVFWLGGSLHLPAIFKPKAPPTAQLTQAQAELAAAQQAQKQAEAALAAAKAQEAAKTAQQLAYAGQMAFGASSIMAELTPAERTPSIVTLDDLVLRTNTGLQAAGVIVTPDAQAEIKKMIQQALSPVVADRDAYKAALAAKDAQLQLAIQQKAAVEAQIPALQAQTTTAKAETATVQAKAQELTKEVTVWAAAKSAAEQDASGAKAWGEFLLKILVIVGILYAVGHWIIPCIAQSYPGLGWLTKLANGIKNFTTAHL